MTTLVSPNSYAAQKRALPQPRNVINRSFPGWFPAGVSTRISADFPTSLVSMDSSLFGSITAMRARARHLERTNPYFRKWLADCEKNILGHSGIGLVSKALRPDGTLDDALNREVETQWWEWGKRGTCTVTKRWPWRMVQRLVVRSVMKLGEAIIRHIPDPKNPFGYTLQLIEPDYLDDSHHDDLPNGNRVRFGIEMNDVGERLAYHFLTRNPADIYRPNGISSRRVRVPASEIIHIFLPDTPEQTRGYPHAVSVMIKLHLLDRYEEAEVMAARFAAENPSFLESDTPQDWEGVRDENGNIVDPSTGISIESQPGSFIGLPMGVHVKPNEAQHPNAIYPEFVKGALRGVCAGLSAAYSSTSADYEGVTYTSLRAEAIDIRESWKALQSFFCDELCQEVFERWATSAILSGALRVPMTRLQDIIAPTWKPRRWDWVDPQKDIVAKIAALNSNITNLEDVIVEAGGDIEENFAAIARVNTLREKFGLTQPQDGKTAPAATATAVDDKDADYTAQDNAGDISTDDVQKTALNGVQISALSELAEKVVAGLLPLATAKAIAKASFPLMSDAEIDAIFSPLPGFTQTPSPEQSVVSESYEQDASA